MKSLFYTLLLTAALAGCSKESNPGPATPPPPPATDNTVYLRVTADNVQPGQKAFVQQVGTLKDAVTLTLPAGASSPAKQIANEKSVFVKGQQVQFGVYTSTQPTKGTGTILAELVRGTTVLSSVTWDNASPPAWDQPSQSAVVNKTITLP
ncbi:hypothetical protein [Hymenobacter metallicola]|uniref:Uncharacterized protein n=1 Tax=Hymenobacter metallicola TaxID=2563114 RepID=A0A4Z0QIF6_9BACT|nr:hypothetical protein [Hymenobacter metallicola]TGE29780.1 hypothetical protein E5K02_10060 [Hymenobacter metallicola]